MIRVTIAVGFLLSEDATALVLDPVVSATGTVGQAHGRIGFNEAAVVDASVGARTLRFGAEVAVVVAALLLGVGVGRAALFASFIVVHIHLVHYVTLGN